MAWFVNRALTNFRNAINARWPGRDRRSDGTIGDQAHQGTVSDHNPDDDGSVDAYDMDVDGVDVELLKGVFERHESSSYWIHNRQIARRANNWRREPYFGDNPHTSHVHFNTRQSHENSSAPWVIPGGTPLKEVDDMALIHGTVPADGSTVLVCSPDDVVSDISVGCDFGQAKIRVADHIRGKGWQVHEFVVDANDPMRPTVGGKRGVDRRSIRRVPLREGEPVTDDGAALGYVCWW